MVSVFDWDDADSPVACYAAVAVIWLGGLAVYLVGPLLPAALVSTAVVCLVAVLISNDHTGTKARRLFSAFLIALTRFSIRHAWPVIRPIATPSPVDVADRVRSVCVASPRAPSVASC